MHWDLNPRLLSVVRDTLNLSVNFFGENVDKKVDCLFLLRNNVHALYIKNGGPEIKTAQN